MPRAYSLDLRERVLAAAREEDLSHVALAARFRVGESTVRAWLRRARETGSVAAKPHGGGTPPTVDAAGAPVLVALVLEQNDRTLEELAALYGARQDTTASRSAIWRACQRLDLRRKKKEPPPRRADA
ncbi:MAG TPA: helix-turn-helix domain-containing protein [Gemmatimonadaceae bacterium]|nr:helix-turn-helix domain-containing protein [Gemmatimonadaceae bacterium]